MFENVYGGDVGNGLESGLRSVGVRVFLLAIQITKLQERATT